MNVFGEVITVDIGVLVVEAGGLAVEVGFLRRRDVGFEGFETWV